VTTPRTTLSEPGDRIQVRWLSRDPVLNTIEGTQGNGPPLLLFAFFPVFLLLAFSPLCFAQLREIMRVRRPYKKGVLVQGTVVSVETQHHGTTLPGWPRSTAEVQVARQLPGGGRTESVVSCSNDWLLHHLPPGATVRILLPSEKLGKGVLVESFIR
jgi:hypothetical protein